MPRVTGTLEAALYATDLDRAERFYTDIVGLTVIARKPGRHVFFAVGRSVLLVFDPRATLSPPRPDAALPVPAHGATGPGHYCFRVDRDELDAWRLHLERHGIAIEAEIAWPNGARSIYVRDPAGNSIEFGEEALWFSPGATDAPDDGDR
ncbi:glyoxalase/bleomycin resistance protein/dioxygenase superfamily protein [Albidovulum inexpectatum]|uniref:Glyoxalase/bleomycin resistance protein/dioxygenase superfamily protein n=1 Tax=Albidovulum inexpectatum TaxID=196587 RepID=A0A2S5JK53_9RHOB|nr:VOC family protein [Albidovulum inexpectatum]PPB81635.1 glyoxalase/bleomycin resistance protein/dioxygenase superfamily protein [Albidovulum inexpectatum]